MEIVEIVKLQVVQICKGIFKKCIFSQAIHVCLSIFIFTFFEIFDISRFMAFVIRIHLQSHLPVMLAPMLLAKLWCMVEHPLMQRKQLSVYYPERWKSSR